MSSFQVLVIMYNPHKNNDIMDSQHTRGNAHDGGHCFGGACTRELSNFTEDRGLNKIYSNYQNPWICETNRTVETIRALVTPVTRSSSESQPNLETRTTFRVRARVTHRRGKSGTKFSCPERLCK